MDHDSPEATEAATPEQEAEAARAALAAGDLSTAAVHIGRALEHDLARPEWLTLLESIVSAGRADPEIIAPLGEHPYFATVAVRAYALARSGDLTAAIQLLLRVFAVEPSVPFVRWAASFVAAPGAAAKVDVDAIVYSLIQLLQGYPGDDLDEEQRAALAETIPLLDALNAAHGDAFRLSWARSMILRKVQRYAEAAAAGERAFAADPSSATAVALAYARREEGDFAAARAAFEAAIRLEPDNLEVRADLAQMLCSRGSMDEGLSIFEGILARDPAHHCAYPAQRYYRCLRDGDPRAYAELAAHAAAHPDDEEAAAWVARARHAWLHPPTAPEVNESFVGHIAAAVQHFGSHDRALERFGARAHRYRLEAPMSEARVEILEARAGVKLPADYRAFITRVAASGAGPYHGLLPLDAPSQLDSLDGSFPHLRAFQPDVEAMSERERQAFEGDASAAGTIALAHQGCQYFSLLVVKGARAGSVWADIRSAGLGFVPTHDSFTDWYAAWVRALSQGEELGIPVPTGRCAPQHALSSYLQSWDERHGTSAGRTAEQLHEALSGIGEGGIATRADGSRYFDAGDFLDVCPICNGMFEYFFENGGLTPQQITPGVPPKAARWRGDRS